MKNNTPMEVIDVTNSVKDLSRLQAYLEVLSYIQEILDSLKSRMLFTYELDKTEADTYNLFVNGYFLKKTHMQSERELVEILKNLQFGADNGIVAALNTLVDKIQSKINHQEHLIKF